jgi:hypothetical protein
MEPASYLGYCYRRAYCRSVLCKLPPRQLYCRPATPGCGAGGAQVSDPDNDNRPATRDDIIYAVAVVIIALMLCSATDTCSRRLQINKLREDLQQR